MELIRSLILSKKQFGDGHMMLSVLSKEKGFLRVSAFGAQRMSKRFKGRIDYFKVLQMEVKSTLKEGVEYYNLSSVNEIQRTFEGFSSDVKKFMAGSYVLELPSMLLTEGEDCFDLIYGYLDTINNTSDPDMLRGLVIEFTLQMYRKAGFLCDEYSIADNRLAINELRDLHYKLINRVPKTQSCLTQLF